MIAVERALALMLADVSAISGRIYQMRAGQNSAVPFLVFQRVDSDRIRSMNGPSGMARASIQIDVYSDKAYSAKAISAEIETMLDGWRGTVLTTEGSVKITGLTLQTELDLIDDTDSPVLFRNSATYLVTYDQGN